jgi:hypothetical protein
MIVPHRGGKVNGTTHPNIATHGLLPDGPAWACDYGTSFAAPLISCMGAELFDYYTNATANLVRALLLHFTRTISAPQVGIQKEHLVGLGEPWLEAAIHPRTSSAAFLYSGELVANTFAYVPFLVPNCMGPGQGKRLQVRSTVVIDPPVDPDNVLEYSKARVTLALRKPTEVGHRRVGVSTDVAQSDKWWPLAQLHRSFVHSYSPGEWELQLRLWTRGLPPEHRQRVSAVIEVIDANGAMPVYDGIVSQAGTAFREVPHRAAA